jgi:hypothetical protein
LSPYITPMLRCNVLDAQGQALEGVQKKTINMIKRMRSHEEKKDDMNQTKSLHNNAKNATTMSQVDRFTQFRPIAMHINLLPVFQSVH